MKFIGSISVIASAVFFVDRSGYRSPAPVLEQVCSQDAVQRDIALDFFRKVVSSSSEESALKRQTYQLYRMDSLRVTAVVADSLCARAARTINRHLSRPDTVSRSIILTRLDTLFIAKDPALFAGEYNPSLRLNSALDSVLFVVGF